MKQRYWIVIVSILILMSSSEGVFAQRNKTKCPPGKSFFKADKKTRKRAGVGKKHPQARVFYNPQEVEVRTVKSDKQPQAANNANWYVDSKKKNRRMKKVDTKTVASTKCPRR